jgi:8-oxo-dGTP pyrophosphatase MutT (NUDIX family)
MEGAGVLPCFGETVYLLERNPDYKNNDKKKMELEYPGGKVKAGEDYLTAAQREVAEEMGLTLEPKQFDEAKSVTVTSPKGLGIRLYRVELTPEQVAEIPGLSRQLQTAAQANPAECESLGIVAVTRTDLLAGSLPRPLRSFNRILIDKLQAANLM